MKYIEKQIRKNPSKNDYVIGIGKNDISEADEDKYFYHNDKGKFVSDVIIYYKQDHSEIQKEFQSLEDTIADKNKSIEKLQNELASIHSDHKKEVKLMQDEFNAKIDKLNKDLSAKDLEIHNLKSDYDKEIASLNLRHNENVYKTHDKYKNSLLSLRMKDHQDNKRFIAEFRDLGFFEKHTSKFDNIINEMEKTDEIKLTKIDEDFPNLQLETSEDNSEANE